MISHPVVDIDEREREDIIRAIRHLAGRRRIPARRQFMWHLFVDGMRFVKRVFDLFVTLILLVATFPVFFLIYIAIKLDDGGPVLYTQTRVGKDGRHFRFFKFRSMIVDADSKYKDLAGQNQSADGVIFKNREDKRITRVGKWLRRSSMDELPQLFNVLRGDMSLVGPRPPLPSEVRQYTLEDRKRLHVLPGITCKWQIMGRSDIPFKEQVALDKEYIASQSTWNDIVILLKTIPAVWTGRGAY